MNLQEVADVYPSRKVKGYNLKLLIRLMRISHGIVRLNFKESKQDDERKHGINTDLKNISDDIAKYMRIAASNEMKRLKAKETSDDK